MATPALPRRAWKEATGTGGGGVHKAHRQVSMKDRCAQEAFGSGVTPFGGYATYTCRFT